MTIKLEYAGYRGAFDTRPHNVLVKVKRDKPEYWPWQRVLDDFRINKYPKDLGGGWYLTSLSNKSDKYMTEKFGTGHLRCDDRKGLIEVLKQIIPDWIGKDYSGGQERVRVYRLGVW